MASKPTEEVYQASPETCIKVAREYLRDANKLLLAGDAEAAGDKVRSAMHWLPTWLEQEWDDRMTAWMERDGSPRG